jgi:hypothetical protein
MNLDEAGRLQKAWKTKHGDKPCHHTRVIDSLIEGGKYTEKVGCEECGAIFPDPRQNPRG